MSEPIKELRVVRGLYNEWWSLVIDGNMNTHTTHYPLIRSNEWQALEMSASESFYAEKLHFSIQLIKPSFWFLLPHGHNTVSLKTKSFILSSIFCSQNAKNLPQKYRKIDSWKCFDSFKRNCFY